MSPWDRLLERPSAREHFVQLCEPNDQILARNAGQYLWEGLRRGGGAVVVVTNESQELFSRQLIELGADLCSLVQNRQIIFLNAHQALARFMVLGQPDWDRFEQVTRHAMRQARPVNPNEDLRVYGEMVGVLWRARQYAAAIRLEQFWNKLLEQTPFSLYCAYSFDVFSKDFDGAALEGVLCTHTHLLPAKLNGALRIAIDRSMDEVLGERSAELQQTIYDVQRPSWAVMSPAEGAVLWLRKHLPEQADAILNRARQHYHALLDAEHSASPIPQAT